MAAHNYSAAVWRGYGGERDQARNALAAVNQRNIAMQRALDDLAERFEAMAGRVARAEAAMRKAG